MDFWRRSARISRLEGKTNHHNSKSALNVTTNLIKEIDEKRCRWYSHVKRMGKDRLPELLMNWQKDGRDRRGHLKKRLRDNLRGEWKRHSVEENFRKFRKMMINQK